MKKLYTLSLLIALITVGFAQAQLCRIASDTSIYSFDGDEQTIVKKYRYDPAGVIKRLDYYFYDEGSEVFIAAGYDSLYTSAGKVDSILAFNANNLFSGRITRNTWSGSLLVKQASYRPPYVNMAGLQPAETDTTFYTYSGGLLTTVERKDYVDDVLESTDLTENIVFTNGNITSVTRHEESGPGTFDGTLEYDTYPNPLKGLAYRDGDFLGLFNTNNVVLAYETGDPSNVIFANTLSYADDKLNSLSQEFPSGTQYVAYEYDCSFVLSVFDGVAQHEASFYPNPSANGIFKLDAATDYTKVTVSNSNGQVIKQYNVSSADLTLDLSAAPAGIYTVQLSGAEKVAYAKLVK